ncbi:uncharacterized protein LOC144666307 [Oculina patagonica]
MAISRNDFNDGGPVSFAEFEDVSEDVTERSLTLYCNANSEETQRDPESTSDDEIISINCASHEKNEKVDIRKKGTEIYIVVSGHPLVQVGSGGNVLKTKSCEVCSKNCYHGYSSSDEENNEDTFKIEEVEADSHAHIDLFEHETKCSEMIYSAMPVIPKRGCMKSSQYVVLITNLKELQDTGDFVGHGQMIEKQMAQLRLTADPDMEASLQIERAMALYFQNNLKDAKKILKLVVRQEQQLKNPGILAGRALNLLTAIYRRQGKFGKAMECVTRANTCLERQDSADDKAELHHSYGALLTALPAAKDPEARRGTKEEAYKSYEMSAHYKVNDEFKEYVHVKMAALLLESRSNTGRIVTFLTKKDILKAKKHLDFVEFRVADNMALGTRIKLLLLRSDEYLCEGNVAMAMEKAQEANELIHRHGFQLEFDSATKRIEHLSAMQKQEKKERWNSELCSSSSSTDSESSHSE